MKIKDLYIQKKPVISFEIFPPKKNTPIDTVYDTIEALKDLKPDFISVTYGAGGSTARTTLELASTIRNKYKVETLAHLTCATSTKNEITDVLKNLSKNGIQNILALRGDLPSDKNFNFPNPLHYNHASDLVTHIRNHGDFCVGGAVYPEGHTECENIETDLAHVKRKVDSGTDFLISQLFFDNELFYDFLNKARQTGIDVPISAGILPVLSKGQMDHIIKLSGCNLPPKFTRILDKYEGNPEALKEAGTAYAIEQIIDLLSWGVDGIHLYTMNKPKTTRKIIDSISSIRDALTKEIA
ncbi:MAG: methylenetetrahydrofolate reductase [NAD(P)H] [Peptostreptococcaceae bacterium]|nr:methylenetetrahydrofolate reductase [NAD(P)H] [Peptostreptococcaceae bacterium]